MIDTLERPLVITSQTAEGNPTESFARDVLAGLISSPKRLSSIYFYDEKGSQLFEQICDLDEYYLTRKETEILENSAHEILESLPPETHLIELGSGSSTKTRILLEAALDRFQQTRYSPIDISATMLTESVNQLAEKYPQLQIEAVADRYEVGLEHFLKNSQSPDCIMWLGSSIGNLTRPEATAFLKEIHQNTKPEDRLLLGIDLRKSGAILEPAYDDALGITAAFNLNLLHRINDELGGQFQVDQFRHKAVYNDIEGRIEMYLMSKTKQSVWIEALNTAIEFDENEAILTEYSHKYSHIEINTLASSSGFHLEQQWLDKAGLFSLNLLAPQPNTSN